ncbi:acetate uptake transporter [Oceanirhabdus sp. W0125-5]|uniref:acetate uptake transporter n=1 Tax=Oceanirhabdus sp. W0125-5 TaxID=2999116 RepID=UPI0022F2B6E2|nr:acetate uptake transporter [Oceanirhabdus sp. W0125-5]WBW95092.1 acetate uptake transporter [Oceanirhabdus sp. W0125-5]
MSNLNKEVKITTADPSALGLFGLAMVTLVASSLKLGWTSGVSFVLPWAIFLGAFAQLFACINDCKRNNVFGTTAFGGYALFWFAVAMSWLIKGGVFGESLAASVDPKQLAFAYLGYLVFTIFLTIGAMETNKVLFIIFVLIDFLFIGLAGHGFGMGEIFHEIAAYSELLISIMAFYGFAGNVLNATFGRVFLPLGKPFGIFKK